MIRNMANNRVYLKKIAGAGNAGDMNEGEGCVKHQLCLINVLSVTDFDTNDRDENSHIFDGEAVHRNVGNYQLCDMTDPFLQEVIKNDEFVRAECDVSYFTNTRTLGGLEPRVWLYRYEMVGGTANI